jgi:hypothetical protein
MKKWLYLFEAMVAFTALWLVLLFCYYVSPTSNSSSWDIATAIGTVGAVAIAVWLATQESRRRNSEAMARARIAVPGVQMKLTSVRAAVAQAIEILGNGETSDRELLAFCGSQLSAATLWTLEDIDPLICLPNHCALNLAVVREIVTIVAVSLKDPPVVIGELVSDASTQLSSALLHLESARKEFESAYE